MAKNYLPLTKKQIDKLMQQHCSSDNWDNVTAAEGFDPARVTNCRFFGKIKLGKFEGMATVCADLKRPTGITNATIENCDIGDNVYINNVKSCIANYKIDDEVVIENVDSIVVEGKSTFGNGVEVSVLNESGGREIPIYNELSAQLGYVIAVYRHRPKLIKKICGMIAEYAETVKSAKGHIGNRSRILHSHIIKNVNIGEATIIEGTERLENGSINSRADDNVYVGPAVIAEDFIMASGAKVSNGTIIEKCFIGQGTELSKQYSAENSVFFANCAGFHGEACSIFAGPYTVTHHKSTLLIAGLFSFLNSGSGSNQSNHMYKLGPMHQGVIERGSKTTSDSYLLWPSKIGAFTLVMGRHYLNSDTSDLPFSYLIEHNDGSVLVPAINLKSVGTIRDARKWPRRDKRKSKVLLDNINFNLLSPYTIQKMVTGTKLLAELQLASGANCQMFTYNSVNITNASLKRGVKLYNLAIDKFVGNSLINRLNGTSFKTNKQIAERLKPDSKKGSGKWVDVAGMFAPQSMIEKLMDDIEKGKIDGLAKINDSFKTMHENYYSYEWTWAKNLLEKRTGKSIAEFTAEDVTNITEQWKQSVVGLDNMLLEDAKKEFSEITRTGFGADGDSNVVREDFDAVIGSYEDSSFVQEIQEHIVKKSALGDELIERMKKVTK